MVLVCVVSKEEEGRRGRTIIRSNYNELKNGTIFCGWKFAEEANFWKLKSHYILFALFQLDRCCHAGAQYVQEMWHHNS